MANRKSINIKNLIFVDVTDCYLSIVNKKVMSIIDLNNKNP